MKTTLLNEKDHIHRISLIQSGLIITILLIVSPLITICYEIFKLDYHILEPSIALLVIVVILFYVKKGMYLQKNYGEFIPIIHKILHILSVGTMLVFCTLDLFGSGRILMNEITLVFIVCFPIEIYITMSNRNRIMAHLNNQNYKSISLFFILSVFFTCLASMILLLGIHSNPIMLILFSVLFTIPLFFIVLLGRELID
jgi:hypothetical protein